MTKSGRRDEPGRDPDQLQRRQAVQRERRPGQRATDTQTVKTESRGLDITSAACVGTIVGSDNDFTGNRVAPFRDLGTGTVFEQGNQHPTVSAGPDLTTSVGADTVLNGAVSDDGPAPIATALMVSDRAAPPSATPLQSTRLPVHRARHLHPSARRH